MQRDAVAKAEKAAVDAATAALDAEDRYREARREMAEDLAHAEAAYRAAFAEASRKTEAAYRLAAHQGPLNADRASQLKAMAGLFRMPIAGGP
jgi:hypothetical protein